MRPETGDRRTFGSQGMTGRLRRVLVRRPDRSFGEADPGLWHYSARPNLDRARAEHDAFVRLLREAGTEVLYHEAACDSADAIYTHDPCIVADAGAIVLRMGKRLRAAEPEAIAETLGRLGVPVLARLAGEATAEGGDLLWLDRATLAVGLGERTNAAGAEQLEACLSSQGVRVLRVPLPKSADPEACLHLMSFVSLIDRDLAVVYPPLLPAPLRHALSQRGFRLVEVPDEEYASQGPNVLALAPRDCLMLEGNPVTLSRLERAACRVQTYRGDEISLKAEGGPTCLTRPLLRDEP